jgi:arabinosaccharide transport system substrate-binding protein
MKRIGLAVLLCFLMASIPLFATGQSDTGTTEGPRKVVLWSFAPNNLEEWEEREADIEAKFGVDLVPELVAQDAFIQKLQAVMMDGEGVPDIIEWMIENNRILFADPDKCFVLPLDDYVADSDAFSKVVPGRVKWVTYGDHVYGLPHDVHPVVLIYNDTLWKSVGVDVATIETWDEFFEASKLLTEEKEGGKPLHYALPWGNDGLGNTMFMIWQQTGANILDANGNPTFTSPKFKAFVNKWLEWVDTGAFCMWDWGNFGALLMNGTLCSYTSPDWWVPQVEAAADDGTYVWKVRDLPVYSAGGPNTASWGGTFLAIPKGTEDPDLIYQIMEYMQYDPSSVKSRFETTGMLPPFAEVWDDPIFKQPDTRFGGQKLGELQVECARNMPSVNSGDVFWDAISDFGKYWTEIMSGTMTVDQGLQATQNEVLERLE